MQEIVDFILELDKLKRVTRKTRPLGLDRYENTAEHSWQIALLADTMVFVEDGWGDRKAAEKSGVTRIFGMLAEPQRSDFLALWQEFEDGETAEARFAHAADRAMPVLLNLASGGRTSWKENGISHDRVVRRVAPPIREGCPALWEYLEGRLEEARLKGWFGE
jgi:putative hydrolase of HD superfamily